MAAGGRWCTSPAGDCCQLEMLAKVRRDSHFVKGCSKICTNLLSHQSPISVATNSSNNRNFSLPLVTSTKLGDKINVFQFTLQDCRTEDTGLQQTEAAITTKTKFWLEPAACSEYWEVAPLQWLQWPRQGRQSSLLCTSWLPTRPPVFVSPQSFICSALALPSQSV